MKLELRDVLSRLKNVKKSKEKENQFSALCPSHDDKENSLSISEEDGRILLFCHAKKCSFYDICASLDINPSQLNPSWKKSREKNNYVERRYHYCDENNNLLFQIVRLKGKKFYNRRPLPNGDWAKNLNGVRRVLYKLPNLVKAQNNPSGKDEFIYICEGEKDVEALEQRGLIATCNPHGAGKWRDEYSEYLSGLHCVILPDNDEAGRRHANTIANSIYGKAASVRILELQNLPEKGDVSDWLNLGHTAEELQQVAKNTALWTPRINRQNTRESAGLSFTTLPSLLLEPEEQVSFIWEYTLPAGGFSICSAKPKVGKSTMARNLAVCVSKGKSFLGRRTVKGKVLYLCLEEKRAEVRRHFEAMGANDENILIHTGSTPQNVFLELEAAIAEYSPVLVIIDPLSRVLRVWDFNDYAKMARGLEPFVDLARNYNTHIQVLHHDNKGERGGGDALLGSTALLGAVDTHIQLKRRGNLRTISSTNRYGEDIPETIIELNKQTGIISAVGSLERVTQANIKNEILASIKEDEEITEALIKEGISGYPNGLISKSIRNLVDENKLIKKGKGGKGNPFTYSKPKINKSAQQSLNNVEAEHHEDAGFENKEDDLRYTGFINIEKPRNPENPENEIFENDDYLENDEFEILSRMFDKVWQDLDPDQTEQMLLEYEERLSIMTEESGIPNEIAQMRAKEECIAKWQREKGSSEKFIH